MNTFDLNSALTRSARKQMSLYLSATSDVRVSGRQVEIPEVVSEAWLKFGAIVEGLGAPIAFTIAEHAPVYWYGDEDGHPVSVFTVCKWAVLDGMRACGLRRDTKNPTHEELDADKLAHALAPRLSMYRGTARVDDVDSVHAGIEMTLKGLTPQRAHALRVMFATFNADTSEREFDAVGHARKVALEVLRQDGQGVNKARAELAELAGDVVANIDAMREALNA